MITKCKSAAPFVSLLLGLFLLFSASSSSAADRAGEDYLRIVLVIDQADRTAVSQPAESAALYQQALDSLEEFQRNNPGWNSTVVQFRLDYLAEKLGKSTANPKPGLPAIATIPERSTASPPIQTSTNHATGPSGLFPKMPSAAMAYVTYINTDDDASRIAALALQGMINQKSAEVYLVLNPWHLDQLKSSGKPFTILSQVNGKNPGLRTLFNKYQPRVNKMFLYDPEKDWTWYMALMSSAQESGIPVTETIKDDLIKEFGWKGEVIDFRNRWSGRIDAYDWALSNLLPRCSRKVIFGLKSTQNLNDYAVATQGFTFWLDFKNENAEVRKIFGTSGYGVGTSLMGYASDADDANATANPFGIGYVVSDFYANGSFWSSFPNKTHSQSAGTNVDAQAGKIYASIMWSDGDNISFDQNPLYNFWHDKERGSVPVATQLSPTLLELNSPLLDWYYSEMTARDELVAGPAGVQFIFIRDFRENQFAAWCRLTKQWCAGAGFHSARLWIAPNPSAKFTTYMTQCGFDGVFGEGFLAQDGLPPKIDAIGAGNEEDFHTQMSKLEPNKDKPIFINFTLIVAGFNNGAGSYSAIKRQTDRIEKEHPGRYVFLLPKDQFASMRAYYGLQSK